MYEAQSLLFNHLGEQTMKVKELGPAFKKKWKKHLVEPIMEAEVSKVAEVALGIYFGDLEIPLKKKKKGAEKKNSKAKFEGRRRRRKR